MKNPSSSQSHVHQYFPDIVILFILCLGAGIATYLGARALGDNVLELKNFGDTWFDSDAAAYFQWLENRSSHLHVRTYKHPLFSLILCLPVYGLKVLGLQLIVATRLYQAAIASLWIGALYVLIRLLGCRRLDAMLLTLLGSTSAAAMFWFVVPESYPFGSLSLILAAILTVLAQSRKRPLWSYIVTNILTLSVTITNWMAGIFAAILGNLPKIKNKNNQLIFGLTLAIVTVLAGVQKLIFPKAVFPPFVIRPREAAYLFSDESGSIFNIIQSLIAHTIVMPDIQIRPHPNGASDAGGGLMMVTQFSLPGSGSLWGAVAVGLWVALFGLGLWALFSLKTHLKFRIFLGLLLSGQFVLHLVYTGRETFLYSLHFLPLFIILVALSTLTRARLWSLGLISLLLVCIAINNTQQFDRAREFYHIHSSSNSGMLNSSQDGLIR
ncbi:hypothetical protein IQ235_14240 [Oscillatoriales cyanobacterium LEGE 11467]|uniref:Uncharacterized protein n=1 Tax=Zarconia navalis LEGE 11467 TaxID=1828826 RepID=A0A928VYF9_9CYAN|nr:hypothetical protein [Zarconia navalis]MBE9041939.1 hypothetical protein [Zarconia navalis LEGE 11467]